MLCGLDRMLASVHATMTSVPSLTRVEQRSGRSAAASAGRMRTRLTPCVQRLAAGVELGQHAAGDDLLPSQARESAASVSQRITLPSAPLTPGTSVRKTSASALVQMAQAAAISSALML